MRFDPQLTRSRLSAVMARIRAAYHDISPAAKEADLRQLDTSLAGEAGEVLGKSKSLSNMMRRVEQALQDASPRNDPYPWVRDWFEGSVVYEMGGKLYRRDFSLGDDDVVTLGDPVEVELQYKAVEAAGGEELRGEIEAEFACEAVGSGLIKLIRAGKGSSGNWPKETLKRDGPAAWPKGTHMHWDHSTEAEDAQRPERSLSTLAGVLESDAEWMDDGPKGPGLYARAQVRSPFKEALQEMSDWVGVSVRAWVTKEGDKITGVLPNVLNTVDFVTKPGAGGAIAAAFESVGRGPGNPQPSNEDIEMDKSEMKTLLNEALEPFGKRLEAVEAGVIKAQSASESLAKRMTSQETREAARAVVGKSDLPEVSQVRVVEAIVANPKLNADGSLDQTAFALAAKEAITKEAEYVAAISGGKVQGMGGSAAASQASEADDDQALVDYFVSQGYSEEAARRMAEVEPKKGVN